MEGDLFVKAGQIMSDVCSPHTNSRFFHFPFNSLHSLRVRSG
jgi:hypothetical protein